MRPDLSIITPSFQQAGWLKLCAASIADQEDVIVEHIVQDAGTGAELETWAAGRPGLTLHVERDRGMYDAINRGLRKASGEILAYLNCDEQYLPGALAGVCEFFAANPEVEIAFAHALVVGPAGEFLCCRKAILPQKIHTWVSGNLAILTCATFFRRSLVAEKELFFNPELRAVGDGEWIMRLLDCGTQMAILPRITSVFVDQGTNLMLAEGSVREQAALIESAPAWARALRPAVLLHYRLRKMAGGAYRQPPFDYAIYTPAQPERRTTFHVAEPTFRWRR